MPPVTRPHVDRVVIIGGGIVGLTTAHTLLKRGMEVVVLDAGPDRVTASRGNAGQIAPGHPPIPSPAIPPQALHMLLDRRSPLFIPPRPSLPLARWLLSFRLACREHHYRNSMRVLGAMSRLSRECFETLAEDLGPDATLSGTGLTDFWRTAQGEREAEAETAWMAQLGFETTQLSGRELRTRDPAWDEAVRGAVIHESGMCVDPECLCEALRGRISDLGGVLQHGHAATSMRRKEGLWRVTTRRGHSVEAGKLLLAAGAWSGPLARQLGVLIRMQPAKGYHLMLTMPRPPTMAGVLREAKIAVTPLGEQVRIAGTLELSGFNHRLDRSRLSQLRLGTAAFLPAAALARAGKPWCGLRPCTASGLPVVGAAAPNAWIATGHGMMGLTLATGTAAILAEDMLGESTPDWAEVLAPQVSRGVSAPRARGR
ncbi:MAG: FAD-dependent oxidoreductase [Phycisphaerales bacterium]|nr:FAD-dependent oxidoreductase [Phycisphaerales bacterium]